MSEIDREKRCRNSFNLAAALTGLLATTSHPKRLSYEPLSTSNEGYWYFVGTAFGIPGVNAEYEEHSNATVALIEAGGFYEFGNGNWSQIPAYSNRWIRQAPDMPQPLIDWGLRTEAQVNGRVIRYTQGKNLGGSSGRNQMLYHRGSKGSYDAWAEKVGDDAYRWENMLPFFQRTMQFSPNAERRPENTGPGVYDADAYSAEGGPLQVSLPAYVEPVSNYAPAVFEAMGLERQPGSSSGRLNGYAWWQYTVDPETGLRGSAESSLLQQAFGRPSLTTYIHAQARNIVFNDTKATGVNVTIKGQYPFVLSAKKEVISAAGAWHSPQLLVVSGIGPRSTEAVVDSKGRVFGVQSLRVIDSSSFAFVPPGHTQGTTYAHAEKLVQDMLDEM